MTPASTPSDDDPDFDDLLPESLKTAEGTAVPPTPKKRSKMTKAEKISDTARRKREAKAVAETLLPGSAEAAEHNLPVKSASAQAAARLAQIINLHIAGYSLSQIGATIGASADEVDRMLASDAARYVRTQPALRVYVRNYISERYTKLLDAVWDDATDKSSPAKLESQDRALRILAQMTKLHGAEAPSQHEVTMDAAPEAVEKLVSALANAQGVGYDTDIFDVVDAEVVEDAVSEAASATLDASERVGETQEGDPDGDDVF